MTVHSQSFTVFDSERFAIDAPIRADAWQALAENQNVLHKLATGLDLPGSATSGTAHDHAAVGPHIPLGTSLALGYPSQPVFGADATRLSFARSRLNDQDDLSLFRCPYTVIAATAISTNAFVLSLNGDVASTVQAYTYLTPLQAGCRVRLLIKKARFITGRGQTDVILWDACPVALASGTTFALWRQDGSDALPVFVPSWATHLKLYLHAACVLTLETASGLSFLSPGDDGPVGWVLQVQAQAGSLTSTALRLHAQREPSLSWLSFTLPLSSLVRPCSLSVSFTLGLNPDLAELSPVVLEARDHSLVLQKPSGPAYPLFAQLLAL